MELTTQRRLAAKLLKCGLYRVWIDPDRVGEVEEAVTRNDIRSLVSAGAIKKLPKLGISTWRKKKLRAKKQKGKRRGRGSRKGTSCASLPKKQRWIQAVRAQRKLLKILRNSGKIDPRTYRKFYRQVSGGIFKSKAWLEAQLKPWIKGEK